MSVADWMPATRCAECDEIVDENAETTIVNDDGVFHGFACLSAWEERNAAVVTEDRAREAQLYREATESDEFEMNDVRLTPEGALEL